MPTDLIARPPAVQGCYRLAAGTALATAFAYGVGLQLPFLAVVLAVLLLGAPAPVPLRGAVVILVLLALASLWGLILGSLLELVPAVGLILMLLAIGLSAQLSTNPKTALPGTFMLLGSSIVAVVARQSSAAGVGIVQALLVGAAAAIFISRVAHLLFPDPPHATAAAPPASAVHAHGGRIGVRASLIMLPPILLALSDPGRFMLLLMKGGSLAQQVEASRTRAMALELVESTFVGGLLALAIWTLLRPWPSLFMLVVLIGLAALLVGRRATGIVASSRSPQHWQSVLVTALILIGPAIEDSASGDDIGRESLIRFVAFIGLAAYVGLLVWLQDGWTRGRAGHPLPEGDMEGR